MKTREPFGGTVPNKDELLEYILSNNPVIFNFENEYKQIDDYTWTNSLARD